MELDVSDYEAVSELVVILFLSLVTPIVGVGIYQIIVSYTPLSSTMVIATTSLFVGIVASVITQFGTAYTEKEVEEYREEQEED